MAMDATLEVARRVSEIMDIRCRRCRGMEWVATAVGNRPCPECNETPPADRPNDAPNNPEAG
jgi:hypothetical protein